VVPGLVLERSYSIDGEGLLVQERMLAASESQVGKLEGLAYRIPAAAGEAESAAGVVRYRLG
jgi:hypothetical protein